MRRLSWFVLAGLAVVLTGCGGSGGGNSIEGPRFLVLMGEDDGALIDYRLMEVSSTNLNTDEVGQIEDRLLGGIDMRPATGELYTYDATTDSVYVVSTSNANLTLVGATATNMAQSPYVLDFNPVPDRIRLINRNTAENFRLNPDNGQIAGTDTTLSPVTNMADIAYTNNVAGATVTTLYGIDNTTNNLVRIGGVDGVPSPNGGVVTTIGSLGIGSSRVAGFEITPDGTAYLLVQNPGSDAVLYTVNLSTGAATQVGVIDDLGDGLAVGFAFAP